MVNNELLHAHGMLPLRADGDGNAVQVEVEIVGVRQVFGRTDVFVTPCMGTGSVWVRLKSLKGVTHDTPITETSGCESGTIEDRHAR
jgi:hypothetical protein